MDTGREMSHLNLGECGWGDGCLGKFDKDARTVLGSQHGYGQSLVANSNGWRPSVSVLLTDLETLLLILEAVVER